MLQVVHGCHCVSDCRFHQHSVLQCLGYTGTLQRFSGWEQKFNQEKLQGVLSEKVNITRMFNNMNILVVEPCKYCGFVLARKKLQARLIESYVDPF